MGLGFLPTGSQAGFVADDARGAEEMRHFRRRRRGDAADSKWAVNSPRERVGGGGGGEFTSCGLCDDAFSFHPTTTRGSGSSLGRWLPELARLVDRQAPPTQHGLYHGAYYHLVMGEGFNSSRVKAAWQAQAHAASSSKSFCLADVIVRRREE